MAVISARRWKGPCASGSMTTPAASLPTGDGNSKAGLELSLNSQDVGTGSRSRVKSYRQKIPASFYRTDQLSAWRNLHPVSFLNMSVC